LFDQLEFQQHEGDFELHCGTVMTDHLHVMFRLRNRLSIGQTIAKFKAKTKLLASWQRDFYEHQIRPDESEEDYAFYVFMNPYVGELCALNEEWPWWKRWRSISYEFEEMMGDSRSIPTSWIKREKELEIRVKRD